MRPRRGKPWECSEATGSGCIRGWWADHGANGGQTPLALMPHATHTGCAGAARWFKSMTYRVVTNVDVKVDVAACIRALAWVLVAMAPLLI